METAIGNVAMSGIGRSSIRVAVMAVVAGGLIGSMSACTITTNNCNVKDACPSGSAVPTPKP